MQVPKLFPEEHESVDQGLAEDLAKITNYSWGEPMLVIVTMELAPGSMSSQLGGTMHAVYVLTKDGNGEPIVYGMRVGRKYDKEGRLLIEALVEMLKMAYSLRMEISYITKHYHEED